MIGLGFIMRVLQFSVYIVIGFCLILLVIFVINRGLQLFGSLIGYEVADFFGWIMTGIKSVFAKKQQ